MIRSNSNVFILHKNNEKCEELPCGWKTNLTNNLINKLGKGLQEGREVGESQVKLLCLI